MESSIHALAASGKMTVATLEKVKVLNPPRTYDAQPAASDDKVIAMGRRIQEDATVGAPVETNLKASAKLPQSCKDGESCKLEFGIENTGKIDVGSPILMSVSLGLAQGKTAATSTSGWTCGFADPKLTCASTGVILKSGEKTALSIDWATPKVSAETKAKVCMSFVWVGRSKDGVYRSDQIAAVQYALQRAGFEPGGIDGHIRPKTLQAIRLLRDVVNIPGPAQITPDLLQNLFGEAASISNDADASDDTTCGEVTIMPAQLVADKKGVVVKPQDIQKPVATKTDERLNDDKTVAAAPLLPSKEEIDAARKAKIAASVPPVVKPTEKVAAAAPLKSQTEIDTERKAKIAASMPEPAKAAEKTIAAVSIKSKDEIDAERKAKIASSMPEPAKPANKVVAIVPMKSKDEIDAERKAKIDAAMPVPAKQIAQMPAKATAEVEVTKKDKPIASAAKPEIAPVANSKTPETKNMNTAEKPASVKPAIKAEPKTAKVEKPAKPVKAETVKASIADTEVSVKEDSVAAPAKIADRLTPTSSPSVKSKTNIRSTVLPGQQVIINTPQVVIQTQDVVVTGSNKMRERAEAEERFIRKEPLTIISTENEDELVVNRSAEEGDDGSYTVNRGDEDSYTPSRHKLNAASVKCDCAKISMNEVARAPASRSPARRSGSRQLPTGGDIVAGWPYRD